MNTPPAAPPRRGPATAVLLVLAASAAAALWRSSLTAGIAEDYDGDDLAPSSSLLRSSSGRRSLFSLHLSPRLNAHQTKRRKEAYKTKMGVVLGGSDPKTVELRTDGGTGEAEEAPPLAAMIEPPPPPPLPYAETKELELQFDDVHGVNAQKCLQYKCDWDVARCAEKDPFVDQYSFDATLPPCCTDILREMNRAFDAEMSRLGLDYVVMFGSLLGFMRGGDVIPWSNDNDYLVPQESLAAVMEAWDDERSGLSLVHWMIYRLCVNEHFLDGRLNRWSVPWDDPSRFHVAGEQEGQRKRIHERDIPYADLYLGYEPPVPPQGGERQFAWIPHCCRPFTQVWPSIRMSVGDHDMNFPADPEAVLKGLYRNWRVPDQNQDKHGHGTCKRMKCPRIVIKGLKTHAH